MNAEIQKHVEYASGYLDLKMFDEALREADEALAVEPHEPPDRTAFIEPVHVLI